MAGDTERLTRSDDLLRFDRIDRLGFLGLLLLVAATATAVWLVMPLRSWWVGAALAIPYESAVEIPALSDTGIGHSEASYDLLLAHPTAGQRLLALAPGIAHLLIVVAVVTLTFLVTRDIGRGEPFRRANVVRLRAIAALVAFGWTIVGFAEATVNARLATTALADTTMELVFTVRFLPILLAGVIGMAVALAAEAFTSGSHLREDVEGLI